METTGAQLSALLTLSKENSALAAQVPLLIPEIRVRQIRLNIEYKYFISRFVFQMDGRLGSYCQQMNGHNPYIP